ncbi:uncharacterized protein LOC141726705 [Zonotrichia albicollis]|uniref:uncharacterized protein LOC141726705 n=1 Tax=Zonotrichia albicollis TaxID=44394 RepID=UPI003D80EF4B
MGLGSSRTVEIQISNNTQNITLKDPRTFFLGGRCSKPPLPELSPGSRDTCTFSGDPQLWSMAGTTSVSGILVYEAESFSLAIYFYNPCDVNQFSMKLGLELSPGKTHLGDLRATHLRMARGTYSSADQDIRFARVFVGESHGTVQVSHGPVKVTATMSPDTSSALKVVLEEQRGSGDEAKRGKPWDVKRDRSKRNEILQDLLQDILDSPGSAGTA